MSDESARPASVDGPEDPTARPSSDDAAAPGTPPSAARPGPFTPEAAGAAAPSKPSGNLLDRLPWWTVPLILVGVPLLFWGALQVQPQWEDEVLFQYYWGPIKADADNHAALCRIGNETLPYPSNAEARCATNGGVYAESGYNVINTASWAVLLLVGILGAAQMLRRYRAPMDTKLIVGATMWVVAGSVFHTLEDTGLVRAPFQYFFITPPIYLMFAGFGIVSFLVGKYLEAVQEKAGLARAVQKLWMLMAGPVLLWTLLWLDQWGQFVRYVNPVWVALFALATFLAIRAQAVRSGRLDASWLVFWMSLPVLALGLAYVLLFQRDPWMASGAGMPSALFWAPALAGGVTLLVFLAARHNRTPMRAALRQPVNLLLVFSQLVDGFATALGIDLNGYSEKHLLSARVIDVTRDASQSIGFDLGATYPSFIGFVPVKLAVSLLVIYVIDVRSREDAHANPVLHGLAKFAIIMVGMGPGVRDFLRLALGV